MKNGEFKEFLLDIEAQLHQTCVKHFKVGPACDCGVCKARMDIQRKLLRDEALYMVPLRKLMAERGL